MSHNQVLKLIVNSNLTTCPDYGVHYKIHIIWSYNKPFGLGDYNGGATSWGTQIHFEHHEIWNLDTKERLFSAVSHYSWEEYVIHHGANEQRKDSHSYWNYRFTIDKGGRITIKNVKHSKNKEADHSEGSYIFEKGIYRKFGRR